MTLDVFSAYTVGMSSAISPVATKAEVLKILSDFAETIRKLGVVQIGLFGSFVRNQQTPESDLDVLVDFAEGQATFDNYMDLCFLLEDETGRKVDVVTTRSLSPFIGPHIINEVEYVNLDR